MKYSTIAIIALVQGISAAPSLMEQMQGGKSKVETTDQDISLVWPVRQGNVPLLTLIYSLSFQVSQAPMQKEERPAFKVDVCWDQCREKEPSCWIGMYPDKKVRSPG
ncbi:hypothetical protein FNAPI_7592 [Fusarium napiforme]|uniref:Uncharacterized protein n=1 Tax=Fusarium napiforme TaxID=42672 RepID=A0A8H5J9K2_9HYPO|nr:hypothetical protein FNAPI_7592 [Fusarium napiforme]